jgi:hypothetical protein
MGRREAKTDIDFLPRFQSIGILVVSKRSRDMHRWGNILPFVEEVVGMYGFRAQGKMGEIVRWSMICPVLVAVHTGC